MSCKIRVSLPWPAGFGPFYTAENLTVGSGQIRTNQFDSKPWTLREFKLALDGDAIRAVPFPVAVSPNGALWDENAPLAQGEACRENFLSAIDGLLTDDLGRMTFVVDSACKDAESRNDSCRTTPVDSRVGSVSGLLGFPIVPNPCDGGGRFGGSTGSGGGGPIPMAGSSNCSAGKAGIDVPVLPGVPEPAPAVVTELPSVDEPIEQMQEADAEIRELYGDLTLSGRSAKVTH